MRTWTSPSQINVQGEEIDIKYSNLCINFLSFIVIICLGLIIKKQNLLLPHSLKLIQTNLFVWILYENNQTIQSDMLVSV